MLRLVNGDDSPRGTVLRRVNDPRPTPQSASTGGAPEARTARFMATDPASRVRRENIEAARVAPTDPRWLLAVQVAMALEGGRAAVLPPEKRTGLLRLATRMGVGGFDANLVIAIIQDAARRGDPTLAPDTMARLNMVRSPDPTRSADGRPLPSVGSMWRMLAIGAALGAIVATGLIRWISG